MSRTLRALSLAGVLGAAWGPATGEARDGTGPDVWISAGLGGGAAGGGPVTDSKIGGAAGRLGLHVRDDRVVVTVRATRVVGGDSPFESGGITFERGPIHDMFDDVGVLIGWVVRRGEEWDTFVSAGPAWTTGRRVVGPRDTSSCDTRLCLWAGGAETVDLSTPGLLVEVGIYPHLQRYVGFGLFGHLNVNAEEVFGSVTVNLLLGKLN